MVMLTEEDLKRLEWKAPDYAEMSEKDFLRLLKAVTDLVELEAIANRKRISICRNLKELELFPATSNSPAQVGAGKWMSERSRIK